MRKRLSASLNAQSQKKNRTESSRSIPRPIGLRCRAFLHAFAADPTRKSDASPFPGAPSQPKNCTHARSPARLPRSLPVQARAAARACMSATAAHAQERPSESARLYRRLRRQTMKLLQHFLPIAMALTGLVGCIDTSGADRIAAPAQRAGGSVAYISAASAPMKLRRCSVPHRAIRSRSSLLPHRVAGGATNTSRMPRSTSPQRAGRADAVDDGGGTFVSYTPPRRNYTVEVVWKQHSEAQDRRHRDRQAATHSLFEFPNGSDGLSAHPAPGASLGRCAPTL